MSNARKPVSLKCPPRRETKPTCEFMLKKSHNSWSSAMLGIARRSCSRGFKSLYNPKNSNNNHPGKQMHPNLVEIAWILILEYMMFLHDGILLWNSESESTTCAVMKEGGTQNILSSICQEEHNVHEQSRCRDLMWKSLWRKTERIIGHVL